MKIKSRYLSALFVALFSFYAISPLSLTFSANRIDETDAGPHTAPSFARNVQIFFWEILCSQFAPAEDGAAPTSTDRILIRKARAVTNINSTYHMPHLSVSAIPENPRRPVAPCSDKASFIRRAAKSLSGFLLLYSGLSPPLG